MGLIRVGYCDVFISCLDSHSDGTHSLQRIIGKFLQICSDEETNSSSPWMAWGWVNVQQIWTIPLKSYTTICEGCFCITSILLLLDMTPAREIMTNLSAIKLSQLPCCGKTRCKKQPVLTNPSKKTLHLQWYPYIYYWTQAQSLQGFQS